MSNPLPSDGSRFGDAAVLVFLLMQALDGALTYVGVTVMGLHMEANPLLAWLIQTLGCAAALTGAKVVASVFGIMLHLSAVHRIVAGLAAFYLAVAVLPWVALLYG
ncbi:MAG TPA: DUF5658 family protein [Vicinamibacterales bacterium]|nr:DUF5658 family protein [Vicinamibacterales bacterium]